MSRFQIFLAVAVGAAIPPILFGNVASVGIAIATIFGAGIALVMHLVSQ